MRAYRLTAENTKPVVQDLAVPLPAGDEVRLRIEACGLNFADLLMVSGTYQDTPKRPFTLGMEAAGTVDVVGAGVTSVSLGDRVAVFAGSGGLADYGCFPADRCIRLPDAMPFTDAAAFQIAYGTSHLALRHRAKLQPGETLLVLGAAGGVGLTAVEIGKLTGRHGHRRRPRRGKAGGRQAAGADHLIDSDTQDIRDAVKALGGADVVYDPVGGDQFKAGFARLQPARRESWSSALPAARCRRSRPIILLVKNVSVIGLYWGGYMRFAPAVW